jgi:hypothetical protein
VAKANKAQSALNLNLILIFLKPDPATLGVAPDFSPGERVLTRGNERYLKFRGFSPGGYFSSGLRLTQPLSAPHGPCGMQFQLLNLSQHRCGLILQTRALGRIIFFRILARTVLEIQIPKIVVQHIFLFVQKIKPCLGDLPCRMPLGIEDEGKDRQ